MILTKLAGIVCLGAAGGMLGALKAERKRKVAVYLREYRGFLRYFLILALEGNETPDEILQKAKKQDRFKHMGLQNIYSLRAYTLPKWLPNQANQLQEAFHLMGTLQKNELHQAMKEYDSLAAEFEQIAAKQSCKAKELYTKLGLAGGLLMAILLLLSGKKGGIFMDIDLVFKIAAIGIIVAVLNQLLIRSGREDQAMMTTLAGLIVVLSIMVKEISVLFVSIKALFDL